MITRIVTIDIGSSFRRADYALVRTQLPAADRAKPLSDLSIGPFKGGPTDPLTLHRSARYAAKSVIPQRQG